MTQFKLTDEMIKDIEDKVNKALDEGTIEQLCDFPEGSFMTICWIIMDLTTGEAKVIEPIELYSEKPKDDEIDDEFDWIDDEDDPVCDKLTFGDIEYNDP